MRLGDWTEGQLTTVDFLQYSRSCVRKILETFLNNPAVSHGLAVIIFPPLRNQVVGGGGGGLGILESLFRSVQYLSLPGPYNFY